MRTRRLPLLFGLACAVTLSAAEPAVAAGKPDPWKPVRFLLGKREGAPEGQPGRGNSVRAYAFTLGNRFIEVRNATDHPPQERNPKGEHHEDRSLFSYDRARMKLVLRQFHLAGFVNHYVLDSVSAVGSTVACASVAPENLPAGFRARETYTRVSDDAFTELFEIAAPGKEFEKYSAARFARTRN
ncbi:MAG: hypothetical protein ACOZE5_06460 [Verrucomicrobiota bacterium]